ncbi:MAG TPA: hypothetical protein VLF67_01645 [Candidatus Saccharimonas sp.]|nr:hypothetical protein [Candidatus Saccharimonas sp.]
MKRYTKKRALKLARRLELDRGDDYRVLKKGLRSAKIAGGTVAGIVALVFLSHLSVVFGVLAVILGLVGLIGLCAFAVGALEFDDYEGFWGELAEYQARKRHGLIVVPNRRQYDVLLRLERLSVTDSSDSRARELTYQLRAHYRELADIGPDGLDEIEDFTVSLGQSLAAVREARRIATTAHRDALKELTSGAKPPAIRDR